MTQTPGTYNLLLFLYKKRKIIILITVLGAVASIITSLLITPQYKSTVVLYPTSTASVSKSLLSDNINVKGNLMSFADESGVEQLLQILHSNYLTDHIIQKYDLAKHYKVDTSSAYKRTQLYKKYKSNISFRKTQYGSIEIEVFDENPQIASDIANDISLYADTVVRKVKKDRAWNALLIVEYEYKKLKQQIREMSDSLSTLNQMGVLDYEKQVTAYSTALAEGYASGRISSKGIAFLEKELKKMEKYGHIYLEISKFVELEQERLSILKGKWVEAGVEYAQNLSCVFIVDKAVPADKKSKPVRWLIVVFSTIASFLFALLGVAFAEFWRNFKKEIR